MLKDWEGKYLCEESGEGQQQPIPAIAISSD